MIADCHISQEASVPIIYSYDVFDTIITRDTLTPMGIFALMQSQIQKEGIINSEIAKNWVHIRMDEEQLTRGIVIKNNPNFQDITLEEIYNQIQIKYSLSDSEKIYLRNLELSLEKQHIFPVKETIKEIKVLLENKKKVILISDMYMKGKQLSIILEDIDPVFSNIPLYISSDIRKSKAWNGSLFDYVIEKEKIPYSQMIHRGDNLHSDVTMAKIKGIRTFPYYEVKYEKYKEGFKKHFNRDCLYLTILKNFRNIQKILEKC